MRISAACVEDENYVNMSPIRFAVEFVPRPVRFQLAFNRDSSWNEVQTVLLDRVGLLPSDSTVRITYADDEDEKVQLSSEPEMQEALRVAEKKGNVLQIQMVDVTDDSEASARDSGPLLRGSYREKESGEFVFVDDDNNDGGDCPTSGLEAAAAAPEVDATSDPRRRDNATTPPPPWFVDFVRTLRNELKDEVTAEVFKRLDERKVDKWTTAAVADSFQDVATCGNCLCQIQGARYRCWVCPNYELCEVCESLPSVHDNSHMMLKIRRSAGAAQPGSRRKRCNGTTFRPMRSPNRLSTMRDIKQEMKMQKLMKKLEKYNLRDANLYRPPTAGVENYLNADLYDSEFVCDDTIPDWTHVQPGTRFTKRWKVRNSGTQTWDRSILLKYCWGTLGLMPNDTDIEAPPLHPNAEGTLEVQFTAPHEPGHYQTHWRMYSPQGYFGHRLWCNVVVDPALTLEPRQKHMASLKVVPGPDDDFVPEQTILKTEDLAAELKAKIVSQTATPFNTPAGMTPRKSPESEDEGSEPEESGSKMSILDMPIHHDTEESASVLSLSSLDTEGDFEVVPLPSCFNLNIPFNLPESTADAESDLVHSSVATALGSASPSCEVLDQVPRCGDRSWKEKALDSTAGHSVCPSRFQDPVVIDSDSSNSEASVSTRPDDSTLQVATEEHQRKPTASGEESEDKATRKPAFSSRKIYKVEGVGDALPEALVNGALSAAATVYNTAKTVFSGIQPRQGVPMDQRRLSSSDWSPPASRLCPQEKLFEMGFRNHQLNSVLLKKHSGDIQKVIEELISANIDSWSSSSMERPPTARPFMCSFD
ncbi:unnamed protein product [Ixodes pacificus]